MALMEPYFMVHYPPSGDVLGLDDKLLTIILGALLAGAGMAVCFTAGGATGGIGHRRHDHQQVPHASAYGKIIIYSDLRHHRLGAAGGLWPSSHVIYGYVDDGGRRLHRST